MTERVNRVQRLQAQMRRRGVDLVVVGPTDELRYLLGWDGSTALERQTCLLVSPDDAVMILPDFEAAAWSAVPGRPPLLTWADRTGPASAVAAALERIGPAASVRVDDELPFHAFERLRDGLGERPSPARELFAELRLRKTPEELDGIARVGELVSRAIDLALERAQPGQTELQLKRLIDAFLLDEGADSADYVLVQTGANSASPHHLAGTTPLRAGEPVLIDVAIRSGGYCADIAQNVFLGAVTDEYRAHYEVVRRAQEAGVQAAIVGARADDVAHAASQAIVDAGLGEWNGPATGHGIGFSIHEHPRLVEGNMAELPEGAVITVEPGIYIPGRYGIRIEDTVAVTAAGPRRLTRGARPLAVRAA